MKKNETIDEEKEKRIANIYNKATKEQIKQIKTRNQQLFERLLEITKRVEEINKEILRRSFNDEVVEKILHYEEIEIRMKVDNESQADFIKQMENIFQDSKDKLFVADNFFLFLNAIKQDIFTSKEEKENLFNNRFYESSILRRKRRLISRVKEY